MKTPNDRESRLPGGSPGFWAGLILALGCVAPGWAQYEVPQLLPGAPNPFTPTNTAAPTNTPWNRNAAYTPGGGSLVTTNKRGKDTLTGYTGQNRVGTGVVPLNSQFGVGDVLPPPDDALTLFEEGWVPLVNPTNGNPSAVQWLNFANTNLFVAVDEGVAVVVWTNAQTTTNFAYNYVIGPNLTRRPVRLFWTEGQYAGPRVRFGNSYEVKIHYNNQIPDPAVNPSNATYIANEQIALVSPPTVFLKSGELRATPSAKGRICISYSRRPEGIETNRELLGFEVVDVLEPMSGTIYAHVGDRLLPRNNLNPTNALFCDVTRGGLDATGIRPDEVFAYKHMAGQRAGWVWAIRPTDAPWQLEIFWKAKEQLDIIWPFEVDIYDVSWNLESQLCALVTGREGTPAEVFFPPQVMPQAMPYQAMETVTAAGTSFPKSPTAIVTVSERTLKPRQQGMCLLKYTIGEDVWFEPIRVVNELSSHVYQGVSAWSIGQELRPFAKTGQPPEAGYDAWPGLLRLPASLPSGGAITNFPGDSRWDRYHADLYNYPIGYPGNTNDLQSQVFAVNVGHLSVWWWNPTALVQNEDFPYPIYWPSLVCDYRNVWPEAAPQIVIASFRGSAYGGLLDDGTRSLLFSGQQPIAIQGTAVISNAPPAGWGNPLYDLGFTFETWVKPATVAGYRGLMDMASANGTNAFSLFVKDGLVGAALIDYNAGRSLVTTQEWYGTATVLSNEWSHVAMVWGTNGSLQFYVDGQPAGAHANAPTAVAGYVLNSVQLGGMRSWTPSGAKVGFGRFAGWMDETRIWWGERTESEVFENYTAAVDENSNPSLVLRFDYSPTRLFQVSSNVYEPADRTGNFYLSGTVPNQVALDLTPGANVPLRREGRAYPVNTPSIYVQNDDSLPGYNPNEEHALMIGPIAFALRCDLNITNSSEYASSMPFALVEYQPVPAEWRRAIDVYQVVATNRDFPRFIQRIEAGRMIQPPAPLRSILPDNCKKTDCDLLDKPFVFRDRIRYWWAKQAGDHGGALAIGMRFFYPLQKGFWFPQMDASEQPRTLTEIPWLSALGQNNPTHAILTNGTPVRVTFNITWPEIVPTISICDTLTLPKNGLPAVRGQKSVSIVYQQSVALAVEAGESGAMRESALLLDATRARKVELEKVPPKMRAMRDPRTGNTFFSDLDPDLRERLFFVPNAVPEERLQLKGLFVEYPNYHYLRLNLMTPDLYTNALDPKRMVGIDDTWVAAVNALPSERIVMTDENVPFDSLALCTPAFGAGYVTLLFNNSTNIDMVDPGDPIDMAVIRIQTNLFRGKIDIIQSDNPLDKYMTLRHISDFAGKPENWAFEWQYARPQNGVAPTNESAWLQLVNFKKGQYTTLFGSSGEFGLADAYVRCRYVGLFGRVREVVGTNASGWTDPVLCEGWIKRVLKAINPFDQRIRDYMNYSLNMGLSMLQQAGQPYAGDVPLNLDALNEYGLIPIYQTVLEQSRGLSIDSTLDTMPTELSVCLALMLAAGRLNDLYMVLGNEAYADALNPSISLGNDDPVTSADASSIFAFQNVVPTLLDEELALLRGRDCALGGLNPPPTEFPIYNRLPWNLTADITHGQPAYVLNYGISDLKGDQNGVIDFTDAAKLYPQGHGDAWGHYLSALKSYYYLWRHRNFTWFPQLEGIRVGTVEVTMSALHEVKFAAAAAAKAKAGLAILDRTYSKAYEEGATEPWTVQRDIQTNRVWGVGEWGARVGMGAYLDWVMANALLPHTSDPTNNNPLAVVDRKTVPELKQIILAANDVQQVVDMADRGMNPLGLGVGAVPFDISPADIDQGKTHFEQAYAKAEEALKVAKGVFERIQTATAALRDQNEQRDLDTTVLQQEQAYDRQLLEIYGYPYQEDIGPGKLYAEGYLGPDLVHYNYINRYDYFGRLSFDTATFVADVVVPHIDGTILVPAEAIVPRPPPEDTVLSIEDILFFIDPDYGKKWKGFKEDYAEALSKVPETREGIASLGITELTDFYDEVYNTYTNVEATIVGTVNDVLSFFDGVLSVPVDAVDEFISQWVGPETPLTAPEVHAPNIAYVTNRLTYWVGSDGLPTKPPNYLSMRRAEGEIQVALSQYVLALREMSAALSHSKELYKKMLDEDAGFRSALTAELGSYYSQVNALDNLNVLEKALEVVNKAIAGAEKIYETGMEVYEAFDAAVPAIAGMAMDIKSAIVGIERAITAGVNAGELIAKLVNQEQFASTERDKEINQRIIELNELSSKIKSESLGKAMAVVESARTYLNSLDALDIALQNAETFRMQYSRAIAAGDAIQVEREQARRIWATDLSGRRYRNMAYQIVRNDDLVRYEQAFAMARRYVYLAAKAYDYETGLLRHDGAVGRSCAPAPWADSPAMARRCPAARPAIPAWPTSWPA